MIQDTTIAPEIYAAHSTLENGSTRPNAYQEGNFEDRSVPDMNSLSERAVVLAVNIPTESSWVSEVGDDTAIYLWCN